MPDDPAPPVYWHSSTIARMTPEQYAEHHDSILEALGTGRILKAGQEPPTGATVASLPTPRAWTRDEIKSMSADEFDQNRDSILESLRAGAITSTPVPPSAGERDVRQVAGAVGPRSGLSAAEVATGVRRFGRGWYEAFKAGQAQDPRTPR